MIPANPERAKAQLHALLAEFPTSVPYLLQEVQNGGLVGWSCSQCVVGIVARTRAESYGTLYHTDTQELERYIYTARGRPADHPIVAQLEQWILEYRVPEPEPEVASAIERVLEESKRYATETIMVTMMAVMGVITYLSV